MGSFEKLMSPLEVTPKITFKNRIMKTGQSTFRWNDDGTADGSAAIGLYESIARRCGSRGHRRRHVG